jgi:hypothetical protein
MSEQRPVPGPEVAATLLRATGAPDLETIAEAARRVTEAMRPFAAALVEAWRQMSEALAPLGEYAREHPEWLAALDSERDPGFCRCFCGVVHGGQWVCTGSAEPGLVRVRHQVATRVCRPCHEAGLVSADAETT